MKRVYRQRKYSALMGLLLLLCHGQTFAATEQTDALASLFACLKSDQTIMESTVTIEATTSKGQIHHETSHLSRKKQGWVLSSTKADSSLRLNLGSSPIVERSDTLNGPWHRVTDEERSSFSWLTDFALLIPNRAPLTSYQTKSDMKMAGKRYLTLVAENLNPAATGGFGKISLSTTLKDSDCTLLRAVYFDAAGKVWKKVFYHWQTREGHTVWKNMHIEDTRTLERTIYRFSAYQFKP